MQNVLITGANGFIGSTVLLKMPKEKIALTATDKGPHCATVHDSMYRQADILCPDELTGICNGIDVVVHAAGMAHKPNKSCKELFFLVNGIGTENMVSAAANAGVQHFILVSSVAVYGRTEALNVDERSPCLPRGEYAQSKYDAELAAVRIAESAGMALTILRVATAYGNGDPGNVLRLLRTLDRRRFIWIGKGDNQKSLVHVEDIARAIWAVALCPARGTRTFNVSAPPCHIREVVELLSRYLGRKRPTVRISSFWARLIAKSIGFLPILRLQQLKDMIDKWLAHDVYDGRKFEQTFACKPRIKLTVGLRREVAWYRRIK